MCIVLILLFMSEDEIGTLLISELKKLKLREARIIALLEAANERSGGRPISGVNTTGFNRGDRVRVTNRVREPTNWPSDREWDARLERRGTVTYVTALQERVYFVTDNGVDTWRVPANLEHE